MPKLKTGSVALGSVNERRKGLRDAPGAISGGAKPCAQVGSLGQLECSSCNQVWSPLEAPSFPPLIHPVELLPLPSTHLPEKGHKGHPSASPSSEPGHRGIYLFVTYV